MFDPTKFVVLIISQPSMIPVLLGGTNKIIVSIKNLNTLNKAFNLSLNLTLPDGIAYASSDLEPTSIEINQNNITTVKWTNIKDLAPNEVDYTFSLTVKSNLKFKNNDPIPFNYVFPAAIFTTSIDTMPRGNFDVSNITHSSTIELIYKTIRYDIKLYTPEKTLKGAGTSASSNDYTHIYTINCQILNTSYINSLVDVVLTLDNGIRYIGNLSSSGTDASVFISPVIQKNTNESGKPVTKLYFYNKNLSKNSNTIITFTCGIFNKFNENTGDIIQHGTSLKTLASISDDNGNVLVESLTKAMDILINKSVNSSMSDVGNTAIFSFNYGIGQYYSINDIEITDLLPDGLEYINSSLTPSSVAGNSDTKSTKIIYNIGNKPSGFTETITINCLIKNSYIYNPIVSGDLFINSISLIGFNFLLQTNPKDNSSASLSIIEPRINKKFIQAYYRDGTTKPFNVLAPNDLAEFSLSYDASNINAVQKQIYLDDYFPLSLNPIDNIDYNYSGYIPTGLTPQLISPHGIRFSLGNVPSKSSTIITFKVPIETLEPNILGNNLLKLQGISNSSLSYSHRDQVTLTITKPNLILTKTVVGPNINAIKPGEIYTYKTTLTNTNNGYETDAFDFQLSDTLSQYFVLDLNSIKVSGTGSFAKEIISSNSMVVPISKLAPGQSVTLTYSISIKNSIAPNLLINTTTSITNPYSQVFDPALSNFQYSDLSQSKTTTIKTKNISINKTTETPTIKVGSEIIYNIVVTIPIGSTSYNLTVQDIIPYGQSYIINSALENGIPVITSVVDNTITFPTKAIVDASSSEITINYQLKTLLFDADQTLNLITSTQTNTSKVTWTTAAFGGENKSLTKNLNITINHPNIVLSLTGRNKNLSQSYSYNLNTFSNTFIDFKLNFTNNSYISLIDAILEIPINLNYKFISIDQTNFSSAYYDPLNKKIIISIRSLIPSSSGFVKFTLQTLNNLKSGTSITTSCKTIEYKNDISPKIYSGESSNICTASLPPNVSLLPEVLYKVDNNTLFKYSPRGSTVSMTSTLTNTGNGIDSYSISVQPALLGYSLYVGNEKIGDIDKNTAFSFAPQSLKNLAPSKSKDITIVVSLPVDIGDETIIFLLTTTSLTQPNPSDIVTIIDPMIS